MIAVWILLAFLAGVAVGGVLVSRLTDRLVARLEPAELSAFAGNVKRHRKP